MESGSQIDLYSNFSILYRDLAPLLLSKVRYIIDNDALAQEVVQDTFLKLFHKMPPIRPFIGKNLLDEVLVGGQDYFEGSSSLVDSLLKVKDVNSEGSES